LLQFFRPFAAALSSNPITKLPDYRIVPLTLSFSTKLMAVITTNTVRQALSYSG
jgi:hypothetical protein